MKISYDAAGEAGTLRVSLTAAGTGPDAGLQGQRPDHHAEDVQRGRVPSDRPDARLSRRAAQTRQWERAADQAAASSSLRRAAGISSLAARKSR